MVQDTLRKNSEVLVRGPLATPLLVVCSDPPILDPSQDIVTACPHYNQTIDKINTMFKV